MVKNIVIRPLTSQELNAYFHLRFKAAKKHNAVLISEESKQAKAEKDNFDSSSLHIGSFLGKNLIGCIRVSSPKSLHLFPDDYLVYQDKAPDVSSEGALGYTLPSSKFLQGENHKKLEDYFAGLLDNGSKIAESGRFIHLEDTFNPRLVRAMLCYVWALNLYFDVDYCFFNTTLEHGKYYKRLFACQAIFPEISFDTGAKDLKYLLYADIKHPPKNQLNRISRIHDSFKEGPLLAPYFLGSELVK